MLPVLFGCESQPKGPPLSEYPAYQDLAALHNERVAKLQTVYARGVVQFEWRDRKGKHSGEGNLDMWLQLPRHTALRVEKLGEVLLWLGSDAERYWLFDLLGEDKTLHRGRHDQPPRAQESWPFALKPLALLNLMALFPLPADAPDAPPAITFDRKLAAWVIELQRGENDLTPRRRIYLDRYTKLPKRVEILGEDGQPMLYSTLSQYDSVSKKGVAQASWPQMARNIDVAGELHGSDAPARAARVLIALTDATSDADAQQLQRVFDLDKLMEHLRPSRIED